jgi:hypothetical protein
MKCCECDCGALHVIQAPPASVPDVIAAANIVAGWDANTVTVVSGAVSEMFDVSGNGFALTQAVAGSRPAYVAVGGPNGNPSVLFDGVDDFLANAALDLPAPGTTPTFYWGVVRQVTWTSGDRFWLAAGFGLQFFQGGLATEVFINNGGGFGPAISMPLNTYRRIQSYFSNSIADYLRVGSLNSTGTNVGNTDAAAGFFIAQDGIGGGFGNIELCELWIFNALPTALQLAQLDAYAANRYGASVLT